MTKSSRYFADKGISLRLSPGDLVKVRSDADYRAGQTAMVTTLPGPDGLLSLTFVPEGEARSSAWRRGRHVTTGPSTERWGLAELDLSDIDRVVEATFDKEFDAHRAACMAHRELVDSYAAKWEDGTRKRDYEAYQDVLERSVPRDAETVAENHPDLAATFARIEAEATAFSKRRDEALTEVSETSRMARFALGRHAGERFLSQIDLGYDERGGGLRAKAFGLPVRAFDRAVREARGLRRHALDGIDSPFEEQGDFMVGFVGRVAGVKGIRGGERKCIDAVMARVRQPVYATVHLDEGSAFLSGRDWPGLVAAHVVERTAGRSHLYALRIAGEGAREYLDALWEEAQVASLAVRDPTLKEDPMDGEYADEAALRSMDAARLSGEIAYLTFRVAADGGAAPAHALEAARSASEGAEPHPTP